MSTTSYDAKDVTLTVNGVYITGFAEGTFIDASKDEDTFATSVGAQGDVAISESNNPLGTITITLQGTSPSVAYLNSLAAGKSLVPVWINRMGDVKEKIGGSKCRIRRPAGATFSNTVENRAFEITVTDYSVS